MAAKSALLVVTLFFVCASLTAQAQPSWITTVQEEGGNVTLDCYSEINETGIDEMYSVYGWMFPDLTVVNTSYDDGRRRVVDEYFFVITHVVKEDFGQYHCMLKNDTGEWYLVTLGLNLQGPFFQDLWEMYRMNTIVGCSAFGGFLVLVLICWLLWHFRWIPEEEESASSSGSDDEGGKKDFKVKPPVYENLGYVPVVDDIEGAVIMKSKSSREDDVIYRLQPIDRPDITSTQL